MLCKEGEDMKKKIFSIFLVLFILLNFIYVPIKSFATNIDTESIFNSDTYNPSSKTTIDNRN